jgi:hypothetical protein
MVLILASALSAQRETRIVADVETTDGRVVTRHNVANPHVAALADADSATSFSYSHSLDDFHGTAVQLPRVRLKDVARIEFAPLSSEERDRYPDEVHPDFIRKGTITFRDGRREEHVFMAVGLIRWQQNQQFGPLVGRDTRTVVFSER